MMWHSLLRERKSQIFICVLIIFAIIMGLGAALLFHSRAAREIARMQGAAGRAYSLAKSGLDIGRRLAGASDFDHTYNIGGGTLQLTFSAGTGTLTSTGKVGGSTRVLTRIISAGAPATTWAKVYALKKDSLGDDFLASIRKVDGGYYIIEGQTDINGPSNEDFLVVKIDASGVIKWAKTYGGNQREIASEESATTTPGSNTVLEVSGKGSDDGYYIAKSTATFGVPASQYDFMLFKIDKTTGDYVWGKSYGFATTGEFLRDIQDDGTGFVLAGTSNNALFVLKTNYSGSKQWAYKYDYSGETDIIESVVPFEELAEKRYLLAGWTTKAAKAGDKTTNMVVVKIRGATGEILEQKIYYSSKDDKIFVAKKSVDPSSGNFDGFILGGSIADTLATGAIIKIDSALGINYCKLHAAVTHFSYRDVIQSGEYYYFVGRRGIGTGTGEGLLLKTNHILEFQSMRQYGDGLTGTGYWDQLFAIDITDSGFILGGYTESLGGTSTRDWFVLKTDQSGDIPRSPACSIVGNDQNIGYSSLTLTPQTAALTPSVVTSTTNENPIPSVTVKTHGVDFTINTINLCP